MVGTKDRHKKFRKNNVEYRNKCRKRNYDKTKVKRDNRPWEFNELFFLVYPPYNGNKPIFTDRELSMLLNRSVQAIQSKRYQIRRDHGSRHHAQDSDRNLTAGGQGISK